MGNDFQQRALLSSWGKKYMVGEIPPFCGHSAAEQAGAEDSRTECNHHVFGESWSPMVPGSDGDVAEAMDCSSSLEGEREGKEDGHRGADVTPALNNDTTA